MGRIKDLLSAISTYGILIGLSSFGFAIAVLIFLLLYVYPTQEKMAECRKKNESLKQEIKEIKKGDDRSIQLQNIINKQESEIDLCKKTLKKLLKMNNIRIG